LKLIPVDSNIKSEPLYYFRILLDYNFRSIVHPQTIESIEKDEILETKIDRIKRTKRRE